MLEVFHAPNTRGFRLIWLCEELGIAYKVTPVDMAPAFRASDEWRALSPTGKVPVMRDGDLVIYESCAMVQYALAKFGDGRLEPTPGTPEHATYLQWCWFSEATFSRPLGEIVNHGRVFGDDAQATITDEMKGRADVCADAVEQGLEGNTYLMGETFTAADVMMGYTVMLYARLRPELTPNLARYWGNLQARPAFQATKGAEQG